MPSAMPCQGQNPGFSYDRRKGTEADSMTGYKLTIWETRPKFVFPRNENPDPGTCGHPTTALDIRPKDTLSSDLKLK